MLVALDRMAEALPYLDPSIVDARMRGQWRILARRLVARALARWRLRDLASARDDVEEALKLLQDHGSELDRADACSVAAVICAADGDLPAARRFLQGAEPFRDGGCAPFLLAVEGLVRLAEGDCEAARAKLDQIVVPTEPVVLQRDQYLQYVMLPAELELVVRPLRQALTP
jgi:hypothetical protein